ncbi:MAG: ABC-2 family transporter protein [Polyangiales bacterium]
MSSIAGARRVLRAFPTLLRIGFAEAVAYRAEMAVWILATTMPLVMLAFWSAVARDAPIGRFGEKEFVAYFLATFIVRQLTGSWAAWEINFEVRQGTMAMRLLRPIHPGFSYAAENLAAVPLRVVVAIPVAVIMLATIGGGHLPRDPVLWLIWCFAVLGAWAITFLSNLALGALAFYLDSSLKLVDAWTAATFVFSGYLIPIELFPRGLRALAEFLPFRYQIGFPVEVMVSAHAPREALVMLARQWAYVLVLFLVARATWSGGVRRYAAFGG